MDKVQFLKALAAAQWTGGEDLPGIKTWLKSKGHSDTHFVTGEGANEQTFNIDEIWAKVPAAKGLRLAAPKEEGTKARLMAGADAGAEGESEPHPLALHAKNLPVHMAKSRYKALARAGKTRFDDPDIAECVAASFRFKAFGDHNYTQRDADHMIIKAVASAFNNNAGADLVAEQFVNYLLYATEPYGAAGRLANIVQMTSDLSKQPRITDIFSISHRLPSGAYAESVNSYDKVQLIAKDMGGIARIPIELIEDAAINVVDSLMRIIDEARGIREDKDYFLGDGTDTYGGNVGLIGGLPSAAYLTGTGGSWTGHILSDFTTMIGTVENVNVERLAFTCSRQYYAAVMARLMLSAGGVTAREMSYGEGMNGIKADASFLGFPVVFSQQLPRVTASTSKACYFGDFQAGSMLGRRKMLSIDTSKDRYFDTGEFGIRVSCRGVVNICGDGRGSTYGPIVCLKTS